MYDTVTNPIPNSNFFVTLTLDQINEQIEVFPPAQKAQLHLIMQLTLNACHKLVEDEILSKEVFAQ